MRAIAFVILAGCMEDAPPKAPVPRPAAPVVATATAPAATSAAPPAPAREKEPEKLPEKPTCSSDLPEQACYPGCESEDRSCAVDCAVACGKCTETKCAELDGDARDACESKCIAAKDRCRSGECAKKADACAKKAADEEKRNYGCKKKNVVDACHDLADCLFDEACKARKDCGAVCEKKTGCDAYFQTLVSWNGCMPYELQEKGQLTP